MSIEIIEIAGFILQSLTLGAIGGAAAAAVLIYFWPDEKP